MQRVKNVDYDEDDLYSDEEEPYGEAEEVHSTEDREQFATLTPVVRAELEEAGIQVSNKEIEDALWHYYWDVGKSVSYLKNARAPKPQQTAKKEKEKPKSKFDEAAAKSAEQAGEWEFSLAVGRRRGMGHWRQPGWDARGGHSVSRNRQ